MYSKKTDYWQICDQCGFRYHANVMRKSSYGTIVCPSDYDGLFDLRNNPQNGPFPVNPDPLAVPNPRPDVPIALDWDADDGDEMLPLPEGGVGDNP